MEAFFGYIKSDMGISISGSNYLGIRGTNP